MLSDFNREFGQAYDLAYQSATGLKGVLRRAVLVVDRNQKIVYRWDVPDPPRLPTADEVLEALRKIPTPQAP